MKVCCPLYFNDLIDSILEKGIEEHDFYRREESHGNKI